MKLLNKSEILSALSKHPIGRGTEATTYDAGRYVVRVPHTVKIDKAFRDRLSSGAYRYVRADNVHGRRNFGQPLYNLTDPMSGTVVPNMEREIGEPVQKMVSQSSWEKHDGTYHVKINSCVSLTPWSGSPMHESSYY